MNTLSGTKETIFDAFLELASAHGYDAINLRDIAKKVGASPTSLYNHFKNKDQLLEHAYGYYREHEYDNRKPIDEMKSLIETASAEDCIRAFIYSFKSDDQKKFVRMILILKIIYMQLYQDSGANAIFAESHMNNTEYAADILKHGVEVGRIDPEFDIGAFVYILIGSAQVMGIRAFAKADYVYGQLDQESSIVSMLARLLATAMK